MSYHYPTSLLPFLTALLSLNVMSNCTYAQIGGRSAMEKLLPTRTFLLPDSMQPRITVKWSTGKAQTLGTGSRLLASHRAYGDNLGILTPFDSVRYTYSGGRGGDLTTGNPLKYDTLLSLYWNDTTAQWYEQARWTQTFNNASQWLVWTGTWKENGSWVNYEKDEQLYTTSGLDSVLSIYKWAGQINAWLQTERYERYYNAAGLLTTFYHKTLDAAQAVIASEKDSLTYNSSNVICGHYSLQIDNTTGTWRPTSGMTFDYRATGQISEITSFYLRPGGVLDTNGIAKYYYNNANQLVIKRVHADIGALDGQDSFYIAAHTPSGLPLVTYAFNDNGPAPQWATGYKFTTSYTNGDLLASEVYEQIDIPQPMWSQRCRYNSLGQITYDDYEYALNGVMIPELSIRYYYDLNNTGIAVTSESSIDMTLSPLPANGFLNVSLVLKQDQPVYGAIINAAGCPVRSWKEEGNGKYNRRVLTADLPAGLYSLSMYCSDGGRSSKAFTIVH